MIAKALMILGPTASGKSNLALALAQHWPVEIISLDSALVYRQLDIGTAKPTLAERAQVAHHLIDILEPHQSYSTANFLMDCKPLIDEIRSRKKIPLIVGGTMLYAKALLQGLDHLPPADSTVRAMLDNDAMRIGWPAMHARLALLDPLTAARLSQNDSQRIQRALEVYAITGKPLSDAFGKPAFHPTNCHVVSLEPSDRSLLHQSITQRFDTMLVNGFLDEVRALQARGDLNSNMPSMRCVGYRQAWDHLLGIINKDELRELGIIATRQLAKRQLTWLRSLRIDQRFNCFAAELPSKLNQTLATMLDEINGTQE